MRWLIAIVGAVLGSVTFDEEGLLAGALLGFVVGYIIERERQRMRELRERGAKPAGAEPLSLEARVDALTARVAELERTVTQLRAEPRAGTEAELAARGGAASAKADRAAGMTRDEADLAADATRDEADLAARAGMARDHGAPPWEGPPSREGPDQAPGLPDERGYVAEGPIAPWSARPTPDAARSQVAEQEALDEAARGPAPPPATVSLPQPPLDPWLEAIRRWLWGGNTVVRAGVLVLTVGVGLLVKYAAEHSILPLELRLALAAAIGLVLVVLGYRLRRARPGFGSALQGGGVAAIYLSTFFAYYAYHLLPGALTLGLLAAIAACSTILAVAQDAVELAVFGAIGGFLAPVLASSGEGSHVALFSYYALLNAAIAASALYRAWRVLNWVGFLFTFGIASAWGALKYEPAFMASSAGFLALFFAFYVLVGTLFTLRRQGAVDTTLTFGTPLATLALAGGLFQQQPLYLALWCVGMAAVYLASAGALIARKEAPDLAQAYIAVGIGVATLAVPFALENALSTALAWTAEATGLIWVGLRQQRLRTRVAGYVLFSAAVVSLALHTQLGMHTVHALFLALIASAAFFSAACIERAPALKTTEPWIGRVLLLLGFVLWLAGWLIALGSLVHALGLRLAAHAFDMLAFEWLGARAGFQGLRLYPRYGFPVLLALLLFGIDSLDDARLLALPLAIVASYWPLYRQQIGTTALHVMGALAIALWTVDLGHYLASDLADGWQAALHLAPPLLPVALAIVARPAWPFAAYTRAYRLWAAWPLLILIELSALIAQGASDGASRPLPYLPLLNPIDLAQLFWLAAVVALARTPELARWRKLAQGIAGAGGFIALNGTIVRTAHHWAGVPFHELEFPSDPGVQAAFSILWTVLALIAMVLAHKRARRAPWIAGAGLLTVVVAKLFLLDLDGLSSGMKIVTFLAVGVLLLLIGYFAPVPPANAEPAR